MGNSKIKSEQNSAYNSLLSLGVIKDDDDNGSDYYGEISNSEEDSIDNSDEYFE